MAQNHYLQMLFVVLGLWGAIQCAPKFQIFDKIEYTPTAKIDHNFKDTPFHSQVEMKNGYPYAFQRGRVSSKQRSNGYSDNTPRRYDNCWNTVCYHSVVVGQQSGDRRIWNKAYHKPKTNETPINIEVVYPEDGSTNDYEITYITLEDSEKSKRIYNDDIFVKSGGIGYKNVNMSIQSNYSNPKDYYKVEIYGKKSNKKQ